MILKVILIVIALMIFALVIIGMLYMGKWSDEAMNRIMKEEDRDVIDSQMIINDNKL